MLDIDDSEWVFDPTVDPEARRLIIGAAQRTEMTTDEVFDKIASGPKKMAEHLDRVLNPLSTASTADLVNELAKREGVELYSVEQYSQYSISITIDDVYDLDDGPCKILVVTD